MADCSELAENVVGIGMALATRQEVRTFDDMVHEMKKLIPELTRDYVVDAFLEVQQSRKKEVNSLQKKLKQISNEPKIEKKTKEKIDQLNEYLESGEVLPKKKGKKPASLRIEQLRKTRDNLVKWLETSDPSMKKKFGEQLTELTEQLDSGAIEVNSSQGRLHDEIQQIKDELDALKAQIREQKDRQEYLDTIELLQAHLEAGTLPAVARRNAPVDANTGLRSVIADLRKQLNRSEPARRKRIEKSIAELERNLATGDIFPKPKPPLAESREIDDLIFQREQLKQEINDQIRALKPMTFWQRTGAVTDLIRLFMTTGEFSFALRQGGAYAMSHPLLWSKALVASFKSFGSARSLYDINKKIYERDNAHLYEKAGLTLIHEGMSLTNTEEVIMNYWMDKLPVVQNFNRAAIGFFNTMRADMFDMGYQTLGRTHTLTQEEMEVWANYINVMSGRGGLGTLEPAALFLNRTFFSARYVASRFQFIGGAIKAPIMSIGGENKQAYRLIAREYARFGLGLAAILALGVAVGGDVETDPRSTNFGKIRFGKRRLDYAMGFGQIVRFMAQMLTGSTKTGSGRVRPLRGANVFFADDKFFQKKAEKRYGSADIMKVIGRFARSKLSPQFGLAVNVVTGENYIGDEVTMLNTAASFLPMTYGDIYDALKEEGVPTNVSLTVLAFLGMGLQTYDTNGNKISTSRARGGF